MRAKDFINEKRKRKKSRRTPTLYYGYPWGYWGGSGDSSDGGGGDGGGAAENIAPMGPALPMPSQYPRKTPQWPSPEERRKKKVSEAGETTPAQQWISKIYDEFHEHPFNPRYRVMTWGSGDDQQLAIFELAPVFGKPTTVDIKWFQAYPQRQGIGTRAMQQLQQLALEHGITLTIYPWNRGEVSQSKLTKIYRGMGFRPTVRGAKDMSWQPQQQSVAEGVPQPGKSSGKPISWIDPTKVVTKYLTLPEILKTVSGIPYYTDVVKDRDSKDFSWGVTKKVLEYARELIIRPDAYKNWPPIIVLDGELQDGAHRISTIYLMQQRVQPNNPIWKTAKLKVEFGSANNVKQSVAEGQLNESLSSMVAQDQAERDEYKQFVKSQAGGDWSKGAKLYAQLKKRPSDDIFGDKQRLNQFMKIKFDFDKFTDDDWNNYWLLAQHCDMNRNFQKQALSIIKKYQGPDSSHYKYLYDRISCAITGTQKYGTQSLCDKDHQELSETFDQPYPLTWEHSEYGDMDALATLDDGTHLTVMFSKQDDDSWGVSFYRNDSQRTTGLGDAHRVFATVLAAIAEFVKKQQPRALTFSAVKVEEDDDSIQDQLSRIKLYDRLVQRYAQSVGYGVTRVDKTHLVAYKLTRLKQELSEQQHQDYMAGHCHVMAIALKLLHPDWRIRAHIGWDDDEAEDHEYRVDHVYIVAPDGSAYDCRGRFDNEDQLVGPDTTGGIDTQYVDLEVTDIKQLISRGELKQFTKQDIVHATKFAKQIVNENFADGRNPQDKGDSKRYGVPTRASVSTLRKVAKQGGRKGQLAHWMANMKAGRAKAKK